jgi:hypothetical protein
MRRNPIGKSPGNFNCPVSERLRGFAGYRLNKYRTYSIVSPAPKAVGESPQVYWAGVLYPWISHCGYFADTIPDRNGN